jgi:hypothetical protein
VPAFRLAYGPDGDWVRLFRQDPAYILTDLLGERNHPQRFVTIDYWTSREACVSFRERFAAEFEALDKQFERLTLQEIHIGDFDVLDSPGRQSGVRP